MGTSTSIRGHLAELLAGEAAGDLDAAERAELDRALQRSPVAERDELHQAAALTQLALLQRERAAVSLPDAVKARLERQAEAWNAGRQARTGTGTAALELVRGRREDARRPGSTRVTLNRGGSLGWYAAAALLLVFVALRFVPGSVPQPVLPGAARSALVAQATDVIRATWARSAEPGFDAAQGDVVWSSARQEGYLRLVGLPPNDAARAQYQLWVVDPSRDTRPVDGGVFDISGPGEVIIPIQAKLPVGRPAAFAITLEQPGGVVVSDGPMLLVASVGG
jgi:anti-sigma-K factor RskA